MAENNSFDRLVSTLSSQERSEMLEKMKVNSSAEDESLSSAEEIDNHDSRTLLEQFNRESIFLKIWIWIVSIFRNSKPLEAYNAMRVDRIAKITQKENPTLINIKTEFLLNEFYEKILNLKTAAEFFKPYLRNVEDNYGSFLAFLGSIVVPQVSADMESNVDPYSLPLSSKPTSETRNSFLRKMEEIFISLNQQQRNLMYLACRATDWLIAFMKLPYNHVIAKFASIESGNYSCKYGMLGNEIDALAKVLCNGPLIPEEVIEALYLFSVNNNLTVFDENNAEVTSESYMEKAKSQISMIRMFINTVPVFNIARIISDNADLVKPDFSGGEDWLSKFKAQWKVYFDRRWEEWTLDCKKEVVRAKYESVFKLSSLPSMLNRPWISLGQPMHFKYELTIGFLTWYFENVFQKYEPALKSVIVEGDFAIKENRLLFQDGFNDLISLGINLRNFQKRLNEDGELGIAFNKLKSLGSKTLTARTKCETLFAALETEAQQMIVKFGNASRLMLPVLNGIFSAEKNSKFGNLVNLMSIRGHENDEFRENLEQFRENLEVTYEIMTNLEAIDAPSGSQKSQSQKS